MGSLPESPRDGLIYVQPAVLSSFDHVLAKTKHTPDTFLEHLFDLFDEANKETRSIKVRDDLAQKFLALQTEVDQFSNSSDLMKYLLNLHLEHLKKAESSSQVQERASVRKSRKSQPKRNIKHSVYVDDAEAIGESHLDAEADATKPVTVDLAVVKTERTEEATENGTSRGDPGHDTRPMCLTLHKQTPVEFPHAPPVDIKDDIPGRFNHESPASLERYHKNTGQYSQQNWRNPSEPAQEYSTQGIEHDTTSVKSSPKTYIVAGAGEDGIITRPAFNIMNHMTEKIQTRDMMETDRQGYNYVLNSLASPPADSSQSESLPNSPSMHVPVSFPKSAAYTLSSDEEEPQDLSMNGSPMDDQPQNLTLNKSRVASEMPKTLVKFDRNANHVNASISSSGSFNLQSAQFSSPPNLIYHDPRTTTTSLIGQPQVIKVPQSSASQEGNQSHPISGNKSNTQVQHQVIAVRGAPNVATPILVPQNLISPQVKFAAVSPPALISTIASTSKISSPNDSMTDPSSPDLSTAQQRKKRKKMEDTSSFRDPPEQSLPFNGPNKYRFYCDVCDTGFTRRYTFNRHKCKGRVEKHYCQLCDKAYLSKYKLKDHILVKHEGQTVNCPDCGKRFSSRSSMEMHKKQQHEGQFSIWCKICGKGFNHTGHYYGHMNKHTNTKPFWCQQCGKRFYGSSYLHNHKQVCRGNNELNFACSLCDRKFKCELYLKKHMKIHDSTPIIADPSIVKVSEEDLNESGVSTAELTSAVDNGQSIVNGATFSPEGSMVYQESSDSNSGMLVIDEDGSKEKGSKPKKVRKDSEMIEEMDKAVTA